MLMSSGNVNTGFTRASCLPARKSIASDSLLFALARAVLSDSRSDVQKVKKVLRSCES